MGIAYRDGARQRFFACRQITRLDPDTGHQTHVITTRDDDAVVVAHAIFSRWRQENFFRYLRAHYGVDALDSYATVADDLERSVTNPAKKPAGSRAGDARRRLPRSKTAYPNASRPSWLQPTRMPSPTSRGSPRCPGIPARVPLGELHPDAVVHHGERKRIHDAIRMATYIAETSLGRLLAPHYARADDEARSLLREALRSPADLRSSTTSSMCASTSSRHPAAPRAIAALCADLNSSYTAYPGTELILRYTVKEP